jgi:hypothetical protein
MDNKKMHVDKDGKIVKPKDDDEVHSKHEEWGHSSWTLGATARRRRWQELRLKTIKYDLV